MTRLRQRILEDERLRSLSDESGGQFSRGRVLGQTDVQKCICALADRDKGYRTAILTAVAPLWLHFGARIVRLVTCSEKAHSLRYVALHSFFDFMPVNLRNRRVCQG
jgi:hypothetical protein